MPQFLGSFLLRVYCSADALRRAVLLLVLAALLPAARAATTAVKRHYQLPAGDAATTLQQFVKQSGEQVVYLVPKVHGVTTNPVDGRLTAREAINRMLADTVLLVVEDQKTGALMINRAPDPDPAPSSPPPDSSYEPHKTMKKENAFALLGTWLALMFAPAQPASAQGAQEDEELGRTIELEAFRVESGIALSQQRSVEVKRASVNLVDAISAEGLGRFPDENVAESLQRIPGVQINRSRGEGQTVNIRGLPSDFTFVLFNGRTLTSSLTDRAFNPLSRSFNFQTLPSEFVSTLTVHKTPTADIEEGGLSGTVNVQTPRAFNIGERSFAATAQGAWESNSGKIAPRASALYSDIVADDKIGFTIGVARTTREPETHDITTSLTRLSEAQGFQSSGPVDFNSDGVIDPGFFVRVPAGHNPSIFRDKRERSSAIGSLEFRPSSNVDLFIDAFYSELKVELEQFENLHRFVNATGLDPTGNTVIETIDGIHYATRIDALGVDLRGGSRFEDRKGDILTISAGGKFSGETWTISAEVSKSESSQLGTDLNLANFARGSIVYDATLGSAIAGVINEDGFEQGRLEPNTFQISSLNGRFRRKTQDDLSDARVDFTKETNWNVLKFLKFGGKASSREQYADNGFLLVGGAGVSNLVGGLEEGWSGPGSFTSAPFMQVIKPGNGSFVDSFGGHNIFPQEWLGGTTREFLSRFSEDELLAEGTYTNAVTGIVDVEERVLAGYVMAEFESDNGAISGNFGVRVVKTDQLSVGSAPDLTRIRLERDRGNIVTVPPGEDVRVDRSYTEFLPSANLRLRVTDNVVARFAASRTMARPNLPQLSPTLSVSGGNRTINQQNPFLDPFLSNNIDLSVEWYLAEDGILSLTGFHKDIVSLIQSSSLSTVTLPITVVLQDDTSFVENQEYTINQPVNGEGVNVKGFEIAYQQPLKFLPIEGFGVLANYTFIDNSDPTQLIAASKHNYNVSGYYERNRVGLRLSYTWRDGFLANPGNENVDGFRAEPFGIMDANFTFTINDNLSLVIEAINVLDEAEVARLLNGLPRSYVEAGRRILFGASVRF